MACDPNTLLEQAKCYQCNISPGMFGAVEIVMLCALRDGVSITCDPQSLIAEANCIRACIPHGMMPSVKLAILCQILDSLGNPPAAGCEIHQQNGGAQLGELGAGSDGAAAYIGQISYDPGEDITVCKITATLSAAGTISGQTWRMEIWTLSGNNLNTLVQASSGVVGDNGWNETQVDFIFAGAAMSNGTPYAVVLTRGAVDAANFVRFHYTADGQLSGSSTLWTTTGVFTTSIPNDMRMTIYKQ